MKPLPTVVETQDIPKDIPKLTTVVEQPSDTLPVLVSTPTPAPKPMTLAPLLVLPTLSRSGVGGLQASTTSTASLSTEASLEGEEWDPYMLLERVNPALQEPLSDEQMNTRKWILGALAANALAGKPIKDYLETFQSYSGNHGYANLRPKEINVAINNLDCWERIERIRSVWCRCLST